MIVTTFFITCCQSKFSAYFYLLLSRSNMSSMMASINITEGEVMVLPGSKPDK